MKAGPPLAQPAFWFVAFLGAPVGHWADVLSPGWCRHVLAFGYCPRAAAWVWVDPANPAPLVAAAPAADAFYATLAELVAAGARVLRVESRPARGRPLLLTCVSVVAWLVGARSRALRPVGLYRDLLAAGAVPAFCGVVDGGFADGPGVSGL